MRRATKLLLLLFAFAVPWEYSLDFGEPWGNVARLVALALVLVATPTALARGKMRNPGGLQWLVVALFLWFCCTAFWTRDLNTTLGSMRGYAQVMMIAWIAWEWVENASDFRRVLRAMLAGMWVLALLTIADAVAAHGTDTSQIRFAAVGQDPNDVARFLDFGFPLAALLLDWEDVSIWRFASIGYFLAGIVAVLLTASRGGFLAAVISLLGCGILFLRHPFRGMVWVALATPMIGAVIWYAIPDATLQRLATIPTQLAGGDINQRLNIWEAGWRAFAQSPVLGQGAGNFLAAAGVAEGDTAHNTALSLAVEDGLVGLGLMLAILVVVTHSAWKTRGSLRIALLSLMAVWCVSSVVGTLAESRMTWLIFTLLVVAERLFGEEAFPLGTTDHGSCGSEDFSARANAQGTRHAHAFECEQGIV